MSESYEPSQIEAKWQAKWKEADLFKTREDADRPKFYGLDFFPYPSGAGLSVGHCRNYIPTDVLCRMKFMQGHNVLHPMGFDAFGLPAENEAIKRKAAPGPMIDAYAATYERQMNLIGISYDWSRSVKSCDPTYYRWTQWIFNRLQERGLAYRSMAAVNWDPVDKTVLANEEIIGGRAERSGALVERRLIPQWYFKISEYAQRLLDDLDDLDWPEGIKNQQRNWIGRSEGVEFEMKVAGDEGDGRHDLDSDSRSTKALSFRVFTTRIDTIFGMTFCVLAPEHPLVTDLMARAGDAERAAIEKYRTEASELSDIARQVVDRPKTGVFTGSFAINPANGKQVPIYISDYVLMGYGTGAIMAVPGHDQRDFDFATQFGIEIRPVIAPSPGALAEVQAMHQTGKAFEAKDGFLIQSGEFDGLTVKEAQEKLGVWIESHEVGVRKVNFRLRDWLISRQRYWGCPIPMIHSADGEIERVPDDCLPVLLPEVESYEPSEDGSSPLSRIESFVNVTDSDGRLGRRETDTMGGFACSSWYFLRFCDPHNHEEPWDKAKADYWMPVDCYVGGAEHAVMHLLYARFWTKVLYDLGLVSVKEPFQRLMNQGQVTAKTPYRMPREGEKLDVGEDGILVSFEEAKSIPEDQLSWKWVRMSKSKGNVVTPDEMVAEFGADALRIYELFVAPFESEVLWSSEGMQGAVRFLQRFYRLANELKPHFDPNWRISILASGTSPAVQEIRRHTHTLILKSTEDIERFAFNTYISSCMVFLNGINDVLKTLTNPSEDEKLALSEALECATLVLAPAAPHLADEIWENVLGREGFTYHADWPVGDKKYLVQDSLNIAVQVNGKLRDEVTVSQSATKEEILAAAKATPKIQGYLEGVTIRKEIYVPGKLVNLVVG